MSTELSKSVEQRVLQVYFNGEAINIATNATKWSEVVPLIEEHENGFSLSGKKAVLGSSKGVLQLPDAVIPAGNQSIFLVQDKMKSGAALKAVKPFTDMSYVDLRRLVRDKGLAEGLGSNPKRETLIDILNGKTGIKEVKGTSKVAKEKKETIVKEVKERAKEITPNLEKRVLALEGILGSVIDNMGEIFDNIRGRNVQKVSNKNQVKLPTVLTEPNKIDSSISTKVKSNAELEAEFRSISFK